MVVTCSMWLVSALLGIGDPLGFNQDYTTQIQKLAQGEQKVSVAAPAPDQAPALTRSFSTNGEKMSVKDLLSQFESYGANIVINDNEIPPDTTVTFSVRDVPLSDAMNAFAIAIRAHWEHAGQIWVLKPGVEQGMNFGFGGAGMGGGTALMAPMPTADYSRATTAIRAMKVPARSFTVPAIAAPSIAVSLATPAVRFHGNSVAGFVGSITTAQWTKAWSKSDSLRWSDLNAGQHSFLKSRYGAKARKTTHEFRWDGRRIIVKP